MAIAKIRDEIKKIYNDINPNGPKSQYARQMQENRFAFKVIIKEDRFAQKMTEALNIALGEKNKPSSMAKFGDVLKATKEILKDPTKLKGWNKTHYSYESITGGIVIIKTSRTPKGVAWTSKINADFRLKVFNSWKQNSVSGTTSKKLESAEGFVGSKDTQKLLGFSHDPNSNVANAVLLQGIEASDIGGEAQALEMVEKTNMAQKIFAALEINWEHKINPRTNKAEWIITGELAGPNEEYQPQIDLGEEWRDAIIKKLTAALSNSKFSDPYSQWSDSFGDVMEDEALIKVMSPYKKIAGIKQKGFPKKRKKTARKGRVKNPIKVEKSTIANVASIKFTTSMRREKGATASTEAGAIQLARLKKYINSRLSAEVRRNMGRPALMNQTGRFSNSVQLMSLMEGRNTLIAKYSYLLAPYETFENTGKKRWPLAYNPKTLIAKSIRNLAQGRIEQKLTLRRV